ncbi:response regulator [Rhodoblastus sp.]|uniref:response regulator n=1 Tax=Rhodoblastus sp. TaxID=1962975 RepID=UPI00261346F3|nr:response regulator [Rhodoblastus sp.]
MSCIVILDDRATNRAIYSQLARSVGQDVSVTVFSDAAEALGWLQENRADLIVTDYEMPRIDGDEFITRFRALPGSARVPIMMITVCSQRQKRLRALESGATDFLRAPVDHCEFITRARNLLRLSRSATPLAETSAPPAPAHAAPSADDVGEDQSPNLLARCGEADYAIHVVEVDFSGLLADLSPVLRGHLRGSDFVVRLDPRRYALLQSHVLRPDDARALSHRLRCVCESLDGVAAFRIGVALPRKGRESAAQRAVACLREAAALARAAPRSNSSRAHWRLAPWVELATGAIAGVELMSPDNVLEFSDAEARRVAFSCAAGRGFADGRFRVGMRLALAGGDLAPSLLRLPALFVEYGIEPSRFELVVDLGEIVEDVARWERIADASKALGVSLALDFTAYADDPAIFWPTLRRAQEQGWCDVARYSCPHEKAAALARALRARAEAELGAPLVLRADDVATPAVLPALRRAGVNFAQGPCFGAPLALRDLTRLPPRLDRAAVQARRA